MLGRLVDGLFDYAGMFPPAALSFEDALCESARFPATLARPGLVGADMVLRLDDVPRLTDAALDAAGFHRPCRVCIVGFGPDRVEDALAVVDRMQATGRAVAATLEPATPSPLDHDWAPLRDAAASRGVSLYVEPAWKDDRWQQDGDAFLHSLAAYGGPRIGVKFRMAGPNALEGALADVLHDAATRNVPVKATQGLHHAFSGPDHAGFLNLVIGLRMAQKGLPRDELATLLWDDASSFSFEVVGWQERRLLAQHVAEAIEALPFSIGSCSLSEPDAELRDHIA